MFPLSAIPDRRPFAPSALPEFIARMGASDFRSPPPSSSLFRLVRRCALLPAPTIGSPWLPRTLVVRLDAVFDPGVASRAFQCARDAVACWSGETIGPHTNASLSGLNYFQGQHYLCPLHLASSCAYASSTLLLECLQGSIPGPWLAVTRTGFAPARLRGIAKPRPPVASGWSGCRVGFAPTRKAPPYPRRKPQADFRSRSTVERTGLQDSISASPGGRAPAIVYPVRGATISPSAICEWHCIREGGL
jgi:hypothetical protein